MDCDRCTILTPATRLVRCWRGNWHWQCEGCARYTGTEAVDDDADVYGIGFLKVTRRGDGVLVYERVDPTHVLLTDDPSE